MTDTERRNIINFLEINDLENWVLDRLWNPEINFKIQKWIATFFISKPKNRWLSFYRNDIAIIWRTFQEWLFHSNIPFDIKQIRPDIFSAFESFLSSQGWSGSAIFYLEILLIKFRAYLHKLKLLHCSVLSAWSAQDIELKVRIYPADYQIIREKIMSVGNDFERIYFDLISLCEQATLGLKGHQIVFVNGYALINLFNNDLKFICPTPMSQRLLLLLRRRNILSDEYVFFQEDNLLIKPIKFDQTISEICISLKIPIFARDAIYGYLGYYIGRLINEDDSFKNYEEILSVYCNRRSEFTKDKAKIFDKAYDQLINGKAFPFIRYTPHPFFTINCNEHYDTDNEKNNTL